MHQVVIGVDSPHFGTGSDAARIDADHQSYMDGWLPQLIARGPTLTADGRHHTGSVHILDVPDRSVGERFAAAEPYAAAGWYAEVVVETTLPCLDGTMWDRPAPIIRQTAALLTVSAPTPDSSAQSVRAVLRRRLGNARRPWLYVGVTAEQDGAARGIAALLEAAPVDASAAVARLLADTPLEGAATTARRWRRGGRQQGRTGAILSRLGRTPRP